MYIAYKNCNTLLLEKYMLPCLNKKLFGIDCLGCGMQRSMALLLKGDFIGAFYMYPAIYPLILLLLYLGSTFFMQFEHDKTIRITLISSTAFTIVVSYIIKMKIIF
ncbi:DUF2752 domain-containing protein [Aquimarina sp. 2201CG1-2-11]|uniref:DUF2752 domain-containing protein n=1 Tax=Aquimarina discodermiae TaxID=3231043 RepID=UPI0034623592